MISGPQDAVTSIADALREQGCRVHRLAVSHAFHSSLMEPMLSEFGTLARGMSVGTPTIPVISNLTGELVGSDFGTADYWLRHIREAVRFADGARFLASAGVTRFLEVGPASGLTTAIEQSVETTEPVTVSAIRKDRPEPATLLGSLAELSVSGADVDWQQVCRGGRLVDLPTYAFQRRRFWLSGNGSRGSDVAELGLGGTEHALLGAVVEMPETGGVVLTGRLAITSHPWLADHAVGGVVLFPGAGFVELAIRAGDEVGCGVVDELMLHAPLVLPAEGVSVQVVVGAPDESGARTVSVFSRAGNDGAAWLLHAEGELGVEVSQPGTDLSVWPPVGAREIDVADAYAQMAAKGYGYGPAFRSLTAMWQRGDEVFAEVAVPQDVPAGGLGMHPVLLDGALHAVVLSTEGDELALPFSWQKVSLHGSGATAVRARIAPTGPSSMSIDLADGLGLPVLSVAAMVARPVSAAQLAAAVGGSAGGELFEVTWTPSAPAPTASAHDADAVVEVFESIPGTAESDDASGVYAAVHAALARVQSWLAEPAGVLLVVTRGAVALPGEDVTDLAGSAVWGLVRAAQTEHPGRLVLVDTDTDTAIDPAAVLAVGEPQVVVRDGVMHITRVQPSRAVDTVLTPPPGDAPWRLAVATGGTFDDLALQEIPDADEPLGPGRIRVAVRAIAANFRDVMITLGLYPGDAVMGIEAAGVVTDVGPGVTTVSVGDRVMGLFPEGTGTVATTDARVVLPVPADWGYPQAAGFTVGFATAFFALRELADVQPGQSVLIHAGTGGVGMAAVQLARYWGLEVFATASRGKWDTLRAMGFDDDHIGDSRSLDFEQKFLVATGGRGFDVVLDSLAGEFVDASLRLLPRGGVFLEMGKTDIRDADAVAARPSRGPLPRLRPVRGRTRRRRQDPRRARRVERYRRAAAVARHDVGRAACARGAAVSQPGPPHRQGRHDDARRVGQRHRADHRRHRHGRRGGGPPRRRPPRRPRPAPGVPARHRRPRQRRAGRRADGCGRQRARGRRRRVGPRRARQGAGRHRPPTCPLRGVPRRRGARRRGGHVADPRAGRHRAAGQGRRRRQPGRADARPRPVGVRDVLVDGGPRRCVGAGQLLGRQRLPRRARRAQAGAGPARDVAGMGAVGAGQCDDRAPAERRPGPARTATASWR